MNQLKYSAILLASIALSPLASANYQTVTLGFAQSRLQNFGNIEGVNLKYRYEWDSPFSIISSFTYMSDTFNYTYFDYDNDKMDHHAKLTYYSLAVGPAYRFNDYISLYGLVGLNYNKARSRTHWNRYESEGSYSDMGNLYYNGKKTSFMYGAGVQINPTENWAVDVGYEGSSIDDEEKGRSLNGFNIAAGYRF